MIKVLAFFLISLIPFNKLKILVFRMFRYKISYGAKIGFGNIIVSKDFTMKNASIGHFNIIKAEEIVIEENVTIGKFNRIKNLNSLYLKKSSIILSWNFIGGISKSSEHKHQRFDKQNLVLGNNSEILRSNYIDVTDNIIIGNNVVFGGNGSEIWTHGFDVDRNFYRGPITFGNNIFIGSKCVFTKNITVCNDVIVGPSSLIYKSITENGIYSSQKLYKVK